MRMWTGLAIVAGMVAAIGTAAAEPTATAVTAEGAAVHLAPGSVAPSAASTPSAWPVVSGPEAEKAVAVQKAEVLKPVPPPEPTLLININLSTQKMTVTENGKGKFTWSVSSARSGYRTPTGTFRPTWMSAMWYSRQYDMAPMPHSIFFSGGTAIHATYATGQLGTPASHGCVRLSPKNAATLYKMVSKHGKGLTRITVRGKPNHGSSNVANAKQRNVRRYAAAPYGYAPPGWYSQQYYRSAAPRAAYMKPRRTVRRVNRAPGYAYGYGSGY
jgi:lipoprotein-anchoring transpeptidase ErfK/SrfK